MTKEKAIEVMAALKRLLCSNDYDYDEIEEAIDMAIEALCQEPCEDCISRQELEDRVASKYQDIIFDTGGTSFYDTDEYTQWLLCGIEEAVGVIGGMPTVKLARPKRKWKRINRSTGLHNTYYCSNCTGQTKRITNYCPHCGAEMEVEENV